ncbi:MAG: transposase [Vibrio fluvialis]
MASYTAPREWEEWSTWLAAGLHGRSRWRLSVLMLGVLFAGGRRVVASWIRAAGVSDDYQDYYYFLQSVGRRWRELGMRLLVLVVTQVLQDQQRVLLVVDDSPTKRYGPKVQGAGIHHDPTPGPSGDEFCYGHVWTTLAFAVRHRLWGTIGLPLCAWLYVRAKDIDQLPKSYQWTFQTKLEQGADLVVRAAKILQSHGKSVWCVADGAYAKRPFVQPLLKAGVTLVGRLRKDAALWDLPPVEKTKRRGRKRKYGLNRLSLAKRAAHRHGWEETTVTVYGKEVVKRTKTFLATHHTFGGAIRVVIVQESTGPQFFFCTDVNASVREIIECFADRSSIEQVFHDVKEVWGSGQQQVRNLWSNIAAWHINLWLHTLVELWAWNRQASDLVHRDDSPWDRADRRPSHADRRNALQAMCLEHELSSTTPPQQLTKKIRILLQRLLRIAV